MTSSTASLDMSGYNKGRRIFLFLLGCFVLSRFMMYLLYCFLSKEYSFYGFLSALNVFDSHWYYRYYLYFLGETELYVDPQNGQAVWAFFPLFPLAVSFFARISGADFLVSAFLLNAVFMIVGECYAYRYIIESGRSEQIASLYVLLLSFGPYSFYFSAAYSEALFLMLLAITYLKLQKKQYIRMGIAGALMSATRNVGILFVFVLLVYVVTENKRLTLWEKLWSALRNGRLMLGTALIPAGFFAYVLFLKKKLGDGLAFLHIQSKWQRDGRWHLLTPGEERSVGIKIADSVYLITVFVILLFVLGYMIWKKHYIEAVQPCITTLIASSTMLYSLARFAVGELTPLLMVTELLASLGRRKRVTLITAAGILELFLLYLWFCERTIMI